jgi:hypothetical protein
VSAIVPYDHPYDPATCPPLTHCLETRGLQPASAYPRGVTVLSLSGTDRSDLRWGVALLAFAVFGAGYAVGRYYR